MKWIICEIVIPGVLAPLSALLSVRLLCRIREWCGILANVINRLFSSFSLRSCLSAIVSSDTSSYWNYTLFIIILFLNMELKNIYCRAYKETVKNSGYLLSHNKLFSYWRVSNNGKVLSVELKKDWIHNCDKLFNVVQA